MPSRRTFLKLSLGTIAATLLLTQGCAPATRPTSSAPPATPADPPTTTARGLRVAIPGVPKQFDPALFTIIEEYQVGFAIFDNLVRIDETLTPQPMLAEAWESAQGLQRWTFKLREDVHFHHGTAFTAQDVVHTITRILNPNSNSSLRGTLSFIARVEAIDDYTVRFQLQSPSAELPILLGAPQAQIVAHDYEGTRLTAHPSGTGPFQFVKNILGDRIYLKRNPSYWQADQPQLETLEFQFVPYTAQPTALHNGTIDMMMQVGIKDIAAFADNEEITVDPITSGAYQSIVMRATERPFEDQRVREALKYCMDRPTLQRHQLQQRGEIGNDHPVASISAFHADLPQRPYDPDRARKLLAAAGYNKGIKLDLLTSTIRPGMIELAQALQQMAKPAGIMIEVIQVPPQNYWSDYAGKVPFHTGNWGFRPSIDETFMVAYHSQSKGNESNWRNPKLDELIDKARGYADAKERQALYHQAQALLMEEGAVIIPYFTPVATALRRNIQGFVHHPNGWLDFRTTWVS